MLRIWPMVGRQHERELALSLMNREPRESVVVAGRAGVGKTRLATALLDELAERGYVVERLVGTRAASRIPLGAIGALVARRDPGEGAGILGTMAGVQRALREQAEGRPLVVGVDDAHCLDDASAAVIHQLVVAGVASVLLTVRTGEPGPDAITAVWKDGLAEVIELHPLEDGDVRALLEAGLGGPVDEPTVAELARSCDGNCLFLRELVRTALDDGSLQLDRGLWRLRRPVAPGPRLINLIEERLHDLPTETRDVLEMTAVGEPLPLVVLERLVSPDAMADAARRELIDMDTDGRRSLVRLAHPLYGDVVRARLPWLGMRVHCRTLAEALEATGLRRHDDVLRYATWRLDAALKVDGHQLIAAAELAQAGGDMAAVERFVSAAVEDGTVPDDQQVNARIALAEALTHRKRYAEALSVLGAATPVTPMDAVTVTAWTAQVLFLDGRTDEAEALLTRTAIELGEPVFEALLTLARARLISNAGRLAEAVALIDETVARPEAAFVEGWMVHAIQAPALAFVGRFDEAAHIAQSDIDGLPANMSGLRLGVEWADATLEMVAIGRGDLHEAERLTRRRVDVGLNLGHHGWRRSAAASAGLVLFLKGDITAAVPLLIEGVDDRGYDISGARGLAWAGLAASYAVAGDLDKATEALDRAAAEHRAVTWFDRNLAAAQALVASRRGFPSEARQVLADALDRLEEHHNVLVGLYVAHMASRVGAPDLAVAYLQPIVAAGSVDGPLPGVFLRQAEALARADRAELGRAADELEACGMYLSAAETLVEAADLDQAAGHSRAALTTRAAAQRLAARCSGVDLAFLDRPAPPARLTSREEEVARAAAAGLSSAEIASRLHLSVRTVDTHLGRVYFKLGIAGRAELRDVAELRAPGAEPPG